MTSEVDQKHSTDTVYELCILALVWCIVISMSNSTTSVDLDECVSLFSPSLQNEVIQTLYQKEDRNQG